MLSQIREALTELCAMAARNEDPQAAANLVMETIPESADDQLGELVQNAASFATKIGLLVPECRNHVEWFERLRVALLAEFDPDGETESAPH